jgi:hypothetical protein
MSDLARQLQNALSKATEYELLGSLAVDKTKREECRVKAQFYQDIAAELQKQMGTPTDKLDSLPRPSLDVHSG